MAAVSLKVNLFLCYVLENHDHVIDQFISQGHTKGAAKVMCDLEEDRPIDIDTDKVWMRQIHEKGAINSMKIGPGLKHKSVDKAAYYMLKLVHYLVRSSYNQAI